MLRGEAEQGLERGHGRFERDLIKERTRAGLTAAAARGRKGGRKPVVTAEKLERARAILAKGLTVREAATRLKVGKTALYAALAVATSKAKGTAMGKAETSVGLAWYRREDWETLRDLFPDRSALHATYVFAVGTLEWAGF